jgi:hypothetical protein
MFPKSLLEETNWNVNECIPHTTLEPKKVIFMKEILLMLDGRLYHYESNNDFTNLDLMRHIHQYYTCHLNREEIEKAAKAGNDKALRHLRVGTVMLRYELLDDTKLDHLEYYGMTAELPIFEVKMR